VPRQTFADILSLIARLRVPRQHEERWLNAADDDGGGVPR